MLNLFLRAQREENAPLKEQRPYSSTSVTSLPECERWRRQVLKEITREVAAIQEAGDEVRIRQQNDHINKLLKEKSHWEKQIKALGGVDYMEQSRKMVDQDGKQAIGVDGYFYFGAARDLPGVRELFEARQVEPKRRKRAELVKLVDSEYYGFFDEEDGKLVQEELKYETASRAKAAQDWQQLQLDIKKGQEESVSTSVSSDTTN